MAEKQLNCAKCNTGFGTFENNNIILRSVKEVSKIEVNVSTGESNIKCRQCYNWNEINENGIVSSNFKKIARELIK